MCSTPRTGPAALDARAGLRPVQCGAASSAADRRRLRVAAEVVLLTRNAQPVGEGDRANPAHAVLWGLGRTLALEHPEIWGGVVDVDESVPAELAAQWVLAEAAQPRRRRPGRLPGRCPPCRRACSAGNPPATGPVRALDPDSSHLVIGATGNIGPQLIRAARRMGAATIVAVSRNPGSRLDELARSLCRERERRW